MENFIHQQFLSDISICDKIIDEHKQSNFKHAGHVGFRGNDRIDKTRKDSVDVVLPSGGVAADYIRQLQEVANSYIEKYSMCNAYAPWGIIEPINIQLYHPGGGYKVFHTERSCTEPINSSRHLVFMTYLNAVEDQGGTEFLYQKLIIQPRKGLTVIWPADWTHTHRGVVSHTQEKYIITGWFNYMEAATS